MIIPLSSAIRGSQHPYIEDPNYFRTQNVPGLHTLMNARKAYHICMYENHARPTYTITPILHVRKSRPAYIHNYSNSSCTKITPGLQKKLPQFCMYGKHAWPTVSVSIVHKTRAKTKGWSRGSTEEGGALQRRLLSTQFLYEDGSGLVSTALDKRVLRFLVQFGGLFFSGPDPYLGLQLVIFLKLFDD